MLHQPTHLPPYPGIALLPLVLLALLAGATPARALDAVTLQLKWEHAFQFAGYYVAQDKGFYREAGLDVRIVEAEPGIDVVETVLEGKAQYGIGTSSLLLARATGKPVVALAVVFQHSPLGIAAAGDGPTQSIHSLAGKRVMIEDQADDLTAYFIQEGLPLDSLTILPHSFDIGDLMAGRVDAASVYVTNEPYFLHKAGFPHQIYTPRAAGIDFYGDNLFTSQGELAAHPERVKAFREASLRGWAHALAHPEEAIDLIEARAPGRHERDFYRFEARRTAPLIRADLVEIGYMNPGRWRAIAATYADRGLMPRDFALGDFLYAATPVGIGWREQAPWLGGAAGLTLVFGLTALYVIRVNHRLAASEERHRRLAERMRHMAQHDLLTGLPNRALFSDRLETAIAAARRHGQRLAVAYIDLDGFKPVNDDCGHEVGDRVLVEVATRLRAMVRESDTVARIGGDEFVILLPDVETGEAALLAVGKAGAALRQPYDAAGDRRLALSASIGVALYPDHGEDERTLARCADLAMYQVKRLGRDGCRLYQPGD